MAFGTFAQQTKGLFALALLQGLKVFPYRLLRARHGLAYQVDAHHGAGGSKHQTEQPSGCGLDQRLTHLHALYVTRRRAISCAARP